MGFELIAILCVCNLFSLGVSLRIISPQTSTNVINDLEMKTVQLIDDPSDYDCVDIYKQPAFNHPLLKNHKIQMEPSFRVEVRKSSSEGGGCPKGKVPIKRMNNSSLLHSYFPHQFYQFSREHPGEHYATLDTDGSNIYRGAAATMSIYNPPTKMDQVSMAQIWVQSGPPNELNSIQVGWAVHPRIYGDGQTYLTAFWTADGHRRTGCYNVLCSGFIQVDRLHYPGRLIDKVSVIGGDEYVLDLKILQDQTSGHWWLISVDVKVGYWPKELFNHLNNGASLLRYGGRTTNGPDGTSPPMGTGNFASKFTKQSCVFYYMKLFNWGFTEIDIPTDFMKMNADTLNCYTINVWPHQRRMKEMITFGGPGGNCGV